MKRLRYIDESKGLGILCITFLHYENGILPGPVNVFIGSFMITIFYLVAGIMMGMKETRLSTAELAKRRIRTLGLPYLYWSIITLAFDGILWACKYYDTYFVAREVYKTLVLRGIGTLWFLPALFFGELGWNWLRNKKKIWWLLALGIIVCYKHYYGVVFGGRSSSIWKIIEAPFYTINNALSGVVYVAAGFMIYKHLLRRALKIWQDILLGLSLCAIGYYTASWLPTIIGSTATGYLWMFIAPVVGPLGFIILFRGIQNIRLLDYFDFWGRNSLSMMVTHYGIVQVLITIFVTEVLKMPFNGWVTILSFIASLPIQYILAKLIMRYYPQLLSPKHG